MGGGQSGAEGPRGVESAAGKGSGDDDAEGVDETCAETGDGAERSAIIEHGGEDNENHKKSSGGFQSHAGPAREIAREFGGAEGDGAPGVIGNDGFEEECGGDGASKLSDPVKEHVESVLALGDPVSDGDRGIKMAA